MVNDVYLSDHFDKWTQRDTIIQIDTLRQVNTIRQVDTIRHMNKNEWARSG